MGIAYSLWEQGRDTLTGRFVSMTPVNAVTQAGAFSTSGIQAAGIAVSALAQFGIYYEMRQMRQLSQASFEERRHKWLNDIADQWIAEHRGSHGIRKDVTEALVKEAGAMWTSFCENDLVDVPQVLLLKISRICEFIDLNYAVKAEVLNSLVHQTQSNEGWFFNESYSSRQSIEEVFQEIKEESSQEDEQEDDNSLLGFGLGALGFGAALVAAPFVATAAVVGAGIGLGAAMLAESDEDDEQVWRRLEDKLPLLQIGHARDLIECVSGHLYEFMELQDLPKSTSLILAEYNNSEPLYLLQSADGKCALPRLKSIQSSPVFS